TEVRQPMFGRVVIAEDGSLVYTPNDGFSGRESVVYVVTDSVGQTAEASLVIEVYGPPMLPEITEVTGVEMALILDPANTAVDTGDAVLAPWTITTVGTTEAGEVLLNDDGTITFTPEAGFTGEAVFTYVATDTFGQTSTGTITVTVVALTAEDITAQTPYEKAIDLAVLDTASGLGVTVSEVSAPGHGTATVNADGVVTYTPAAGFSGTDTFTVTFTDQLGQTTTATVTITVAERVPDPPVTTPADPGETSTSSRVLAVTGSPVTWVLALVSVLIALGSWMVRRRRAGLEQQS
ncbi:Ig-like domain-containing protein, partial [Cellulomonas sp. NPDC089187]|uniref:Ig-like domain-containing protein n=1 Tax=Cellulomonas sp. NPDC089187 TaxID=3154970 RepID=UPI003440AC47